MIITAARVDDARTSGGKTLPQLLFDRAQAHPERACMREKRHGVWVSYTWRDVIERVERTARGLAALGLQRGDVLAILSENIVESFWTEYAALALGARVVFAYPDQTAQELLYILDHSEAKMLLAEDQEQVDKFLAIKSDLRRIARVIYVDPRGLWNYCEPLLRGYADLERAGETASADAIRSAIAAGDQDDVAAICYTALPGGQKARCSRIVSCWKTPIASWPRTVCGRTRNISPIFRRPGRPNNSWALRSVFWRRSWSTSPKSRTP
jgi:long-chain acyl-CoA synthetase